MTSYAAINIYYFLGRTNYCNLRNTHMYESVEISTRASLEAKIEAYYKFYIPFNKKRNVHISKR